MNVVVAGSQNDFSFAIIDLTNPATPSVKLVQPPFNNNCIVDCDGTFVAAGEFNGSQVVIYDISNPAAPVQKGSVNTALGGIGGLSVNGTRVLAGELNGFRVVLIDISNPATPTILSTFTTAISGIASAQLKNNKALVCGPNDLIFVVLDYTNPALPTQTKFVPGTGGVFFGGSLVGDLDGNTAALADAGSGNVYLFDVSAAITFKGKKTTTQAGVFSISISGTTVAAASSNDTTISVVSFLNPSTPTETDSSDALNGGATIKISGSFLAAGDILGSNVNLFSVNGTALTLLGTANAVIPSLASIGFTSFTVVNPQAKISATPATLAFGAVRVNTPKTLPITINNTGTAQLTVTNFKSTSAQYAPSVTGSFNVAAGGTKGITVTFTPNAVQSFPASLTMNTNDPANLTFTVPLTGSGGLPHMVSPGPLDFGNVAVCLFHSLNATVGNTGTVDLHLSAIATTGTGFSEGSGPSLVVPAGSSGNIVVNFKPAAVGPASGSLNFLSDDPSTPSASVPLSGNGTPEPPPTVSVNPASIDFGAIPLQYFAGIAVNVSNTGPCEDLAATLTVTGAEYLLTTGNPTTIPTSNPPINTTIPSGTSQSFTVVFAPTTLGIAGGTLTITSNDPANPSVSVPLAGNAVAVSPAAIELVLDRSGSMATPISGGTRMTALHSAVSMFSDLVIPDTGFSMGSVQFDDQFSVLTALQNFDSTQQNTIKTDANTLMPRGLTSIGGGLNLGQTSLSASAQPRKVAIVFTDGFENTPPTIASIEPGVLTAGTEVYAVGLGDPAFLSVAALSELAASSNGKFFQTTDPLVLRKQFVEILADAFRQNMAADPLLTLQQGVPMTVPVNITNCEGRISFVLLWEDLGAQVQFSIKAPDGTTFSSLSGNNNRLVRYVQRPGYRFLQIALPPGPHGTIGPKQLGQWKMQINPVAIPSGSTRASTSVLVESALNIVARISGATVADPILLRAGLFQNGQVVKNAQVRARVTSPVTSLAASSTPLVRHRALTADIHLIPPGQQILTKTRTTVHELKFNEREYILELPPPRVDGVYHAELTATGQACGGIFERYWSGSVYIGTNRKSPICRCFEVPATILKRG
ncbi:MAG: choice-of-anchor D domain-containing protein [Candidatus Angelobacter sp.]